jgi:hypothetical protein
MKTSTLLLQMYYDRDLTLFSGRIELLTQCAKYFLISHFVKKNPDHISESIGEADCFNTKLAEAMKQGTMGIGILITDTASSYAISCIGENDLYELEQVYQKEHSEEFDSEPSNPLGDISRDAIAADQRSS